MKLRSVLLLFVLAVPVCLYAKHGRGERHSNDDASTLSVFSESGEMFFLVLNGVNQNNIPSSKVRVEGLEQYDNDIEIIFADKKTQSLHKKVNIADPMEGNPVNMTLEIVRNPIGYPKLMFYSCMVIDRDNHGRRDEYVTTGYVKPAAPDAMNNNMNNNATIAAPVYENTPPAPAAPAVPAVPDDKQIFSDLKKTMSGESMESARFATAQTILTSKTLTTNQVMELCKMFAFDNTRLAYAKLAYSKVTDPGNYSAVGSTITLSVNKQRLNDYMDSNKR